MQICSGAECRRRNGAVALLVLGSLPFLLWLVLKIVRVAVGGPLLSTALGLWDAFAVGLFGLAAWNLHRVRSRPDEHADLDMVAREARVHRQGRVVRTVPFAKVGPVRMSELTHRGVEQGTHAPRRRTQPGRTSFVVDFAGLSNYDFYESNSQTRARRRMEAVARTSGLGAVTLGGIERSADEINLSLVERVRRRGETLTQPVAPKSTPITVHGHGNALEIASSHRAIFRLAFAAGLPVMWVAITAPLWPILGEELRAEGVAPWVARGALLASAVPILIAIAWNVRAGAFPGRVVIAPTGIRYRFARARLASVEEIAAGPGSAPRLWTDRGPIVISDGFCPGDQYGYLAQLLQWAVVETAGQTIPISEK